MTDFAPPRHGHANRRISGRAQQDAVADPYQRRAKLTEPTVCRQCTAVYHRGRWSWNSRPEDAAEELCPACQRIRDKMPAGVIAVDGDIARRHKDEIVSLARHQEAAEIADHPLNRIMEIDEHVADGGLTITTTDIHLPRRIGEALARALHGQLAINFDEDGYFVRVDLRPSV